MHSSLHCRGLHRDINIVCKLKENIRLMFALALMKKVVVRLQTQMNIVICITKVFNVISHDLDLWALSMTSKLVS